MVRSLRIDLHCEQHYDFGALFAILQPHHLEIENGLSGRLLQRGSHVRAELCVDSARDREEYRSDHHEHVSASRDSVYPHFAFCVFMLLWWNQAQIDDLEHLGSHFHALRFDFVPHRIERHSPRSHQRLCFHVSPF